MTTKTKVRREHSVADVTAQTAWSCDGSCVYASTAILCSLVGLGHENIMWNCLLPEFLARQQECGTSSV